MNRKLSLRFRNYRISLVLEQDENMNKRHLEEFVIMQRINEERRKNAMPDYDSIRSCR